jgi:anti-sigma B factor antagonist
VAVDEEDLPRRVASDRTRAAEYFEWTVDRAHDGPTVVTIAGELDMAAAGEVRSVLIEAVDAGEDVVVDIVGLRFIDSSGLAAFVVADKTARAAGRSLRLRHPQDVVKRTLAITRLDRVFVIEE